MAAGASFGEVTRHMLTHVMHDVNVLEPLSGDLIGDKLMSELPHYLP